VAPSISLSISGFLRKKPSFPTLSTVFSLGGERERGYYHQELAIFGVNWKSLETNQLNATASVPPLEPF
jgi:hypothetical protein